MFIMPTRIIKESLGLKTDILEIYIIKVLGCYFMTSLTAIITIEAININKTVSTSIFFPLVGLSFIVFTLAGAMYREQKQAIKNFDFTALKSVKHDIFLVVIFLFLFVISMFSYVFVVNSLTLWLYELIRSVLNMPVVGLIAGIAGVLYMIYMLFCAFVVFFLLVSYIYIFSKFKGAAKSFTKNTMPGGSSIKDADFEIKE